MFFVKGDLQVSDVQTEVYNNRAACIEKKNSIKSIVQVNYK